MFDKLKARKILLNELSRPDISKAYALTDPSDAWYPTLKKVHESLAEINNYEHSVAEIKSADGLNLRAVVYPCIKEKAAGTVICVHGFTSHAEREWALPGLFYLSIGYNVIIPYQRAHGKSEGKYITFGVKEKGDMLGWIDFARKRFPDCPVVIHGLSMGGGIALQLCDIRNNNIKCIIADAPNFGMAGIFDFIASRVDEAHKSEITASLKKLFFKITGSDPSVTEPEEYVKKSNYPIYLTAGSLENREDDLKKLKSLCPADVEIVILPNCAHGNGMYIQTELYHRELKNFLARYNK